MLYPTLFYSEGPQLVNFQNIPSLSGQILEAGSWVFLEPFNKLGSCAELEVERGSVRSPHITAWLRGT